MPPIKQIGSLPPEFRRTERNENQSGLKKTAAENTQTSAADQNPSGIRDQVNLSESARILLQREMDIQQYAEQMPDISTLSAQDQEEIEAGIEDGFYSSPEVLGDVATKVAEAETPLTEAESEAQLTPSRLHEVLRNIQSQQYDRDDVLESIADKIIKEL